MRTRGLLAALALLLAFATACGDDSDTTAEDSTPTTSPSSPSESASAKESGPQCTEVWKAGETLPRSYDGCYENDERVKPDGRYCEFGKPLLTYDERFYAVRGGRIAEASKPFAQDPGYQDVLAKCSG